MNKKISITTIIFGLIIIALTIYTAVSFNISKRVVHQYYQVYLSGEKVGLISSDKELYNMINNEQKEIKEKYNVDKIYPPSGLEVNKINTYKSNVKSVKEVYEEIKDLDPFTIEGYQVIVRDSSTKDAKSFYILNKSDLDTAIENTVTAFLDEDEYKKYLAGKQEKIEEEGTEITNVYFDQQVTLKKTYISTEENIITNSNDLSMYFLFGTLELDEKYTVKASDTIDSIAYNNQLGVSDFLIANPKIVGANALLAIGQEVTVAPISPVANVVVEAYDTNYEDITYDTEVEYDKTLGADQSYIKQEGSNGLSKVTYATKYMNGVIMQTAMVDEQVISEPVKKIVVYGGYNITYVGNSTYWAWPTSKPFRISSYYGYRIHPIYKEQRFHDGVDITGTRSDNIYAIQSGKVSAVSYQSSMGNYVKVDHGNGYVSSYLHLSKQLVSVGDTVEKGELVGIMGCTGSCTGKHLHLSVTKNGSKMNPLELYK